MHIDNVLITVYNMHILRTKFIYMNLASGKCGLFFYEKI